jgi:hypothetical protein
VNIVYGLQRRHLGWLAPLLSRWIFRRARRTYRTIILWTAENWLRPFRFISHDFFVYDCIDPCFGGDEEERSAFEAREAECVRTADLVFASADSLVEKCRQWSEKVHLLNNACEPSDYAPELIEGAARPGWWPKGEREVASYLGTIDARFDFEAAEAAAIGSPDTTFVYAGGISPETAAAVERLRRLPNVIWPGRISMEEGRYLLGHCVMGLIPFRLGPVNDAVNPVKMYGYAALGKPVVGMATRELRKHPGIVRTAATPREFAGKVGEVLRSNGTDREKLLRFAEENTWDRRAEHAWKTLSDEFGSE